MFPQSLSLCSLRPKFKRRRLSHIPTPRVDIGSPRVYFATGAMAPVRLAAGAILALSGAASRLLPDPWTPPPLTCHVQAADGFTCATDLEGAAPAASHPSHASEPGTHSCDAELDGCIAGSAPATSMPSATSSSSTASSAATPSTESPGPPRARRGVPPTPPPDPGNDFGGSVSEPDSWLYQGWRWVLWSLWSWCGLSCWRIGTAVRAARYLMVSSITLLVLYGLFVVWTCLLRPAGSMAWFLVRYLGGRTPWFGSRVPDDPSPLPSWRGPASPRPWISLYVQKEVRGRGLEHRQPHDFFVCHEGAYARLRHGPLKGRTNRKGYVCTYEEV